MAKPDVKVLYSNGNLGRTNPSDDGVSALVLSGVAVGGQFALGDVLGPFTSPLDAVAKGIDAAYDTTNTCMAFQHISDFYEYAGLGTILYVQIVAKTVTLAMMLDKALLWAKKLLVTTKGKVKLLGVARIPDGAYVPAYLDGFDTDVWAAITKAKALQAEELTLHRPIRFIIEGRDFQGVASATKDLRDPAGVLANSVAIMVGNDNDVAVSAAHKNKYAAVGIALGQAANRPVQRNIGRVKDGALAVQNAGFSNGALYDTLTETNTDSLHDHGYIFFREHAGKEGFFFNDDCVATQLADDYSSLAAGRTMDKVARITRQVYLEELLDDFELDETTGKLAISTIKDYQGKVEKAIQEQMIDNGKKEIVSVSAFVDPDQDVATTDEIITEVSVRRKGTSRSIKATLGFKASSK